ncbi:MAG: transposase, partial [bacterium]|nr:transposase [bacterium]
RIVDSTHQTANVDIVRANQRQPRDPDDSDMTSLPGSPDPDARFGHKTEKKTFFGYKQHIGVDADSDFITNVATSGGNISDDDYLMAMVEGPPPDAVTADKLYDKPHHHRRLKDKKIKSLIIRKKNSPTPESRDYLIAIKQRKLIERVFAVTKKYHGGGRVRYWGLPRVRVQNLMIATVFNLKLLAQRLTNGLGEMCPNMA